MINNIEKDVEKLISLYRDMVEQLSVQSDLPVHTGRIRVGLMFLYFWAYGKKNDKVMTLLKMEAKDIFKNSEVFFDEAELDFEKLKIERPDLVSLFENLPEEGYNSLISHIREEIKSSLNQKKKED